MDNSAQRKALEYLLSQQNSNGFWPYLSGREAALEPSAWAAIACQQDKDAAKKFLAAILAAQNSDGGWSNDSARLESDWSTAAALLALRVLSSGNDDAQIKKSCQRAEQWIMNNRTEHFSSAAKFALLVWKGPTYDYERGWSWTPETFDWVEPTAYVLLGLRNAILLQDQKGKQAVEFAEEFLLSLVCRDGGWNFGDRNPLLAANPPDVQSSALALLALKGQRDVPKVKKSIDWLLKKKEKMESISELSWAALALTAYSEKCDDIFSKLIGQQEKSGRLSSNILTHAVACAAFETATNPNLVS